MLPATRTASRAHSAAADTRPDPAAATASPPPGDSPAYRSPHANRAPSGSRDPRDHLQMPHAVGIDASPPCDGPRAALARRATFPDGTPLSKGQRRALVSVCRFADAKGQDACAPTLQQIAADSGLNLRSVIRYVKRLIGPAGLLKSVNAPPRKGKGSQKWNLYSLHDSLHPDGPDLDSEVTTGPSEFVTSEFPDGPDLDSEVTTGPSEFVTSEFPDGPDLDSEVTTGPSEFVTSEFPDGPDLDSEVTTGPSEFVTSELADRLPPFHVPPNGQPTAREWLSWWAKNVQSATGCPPLKSGPRRTLEEIALGSDHRTLKNRRSIKAMARAIPGKSQPTVERDISILVRAGVLKKTKWGTAGKWGANNNNEYSLVLNPSICGPIQDKDVTTAGRQGTGEGDSIETPAPNSGWHSSSFSISGMAHQNDVFKNSPDSTKTERYAFQFLALSGKQGMYLYADPGVQTACLKRSRKHGWGDRMALEIGTRILTQQSVTSPVGLWETVGNSIPAGFDDTPISSDLAGHYADTLERRADFQAEREILLAEEPKARERRAAVLEEAR